MALDRRLLVGVVVAGMAMTLGPIAFLGLPDMLPILLLVIIRPTVDILRTRHQGMVRVILGLIRSLVIIIEGKMEVVVVVDSTLGDAVDPQGIIMTFK